MIREVDFLPEAKKDICKLDRSQQILVNKAIKKSEREPASSG